MSSNFPSKGAMIAPLNEPASMAAILSNHLASQISSQLPESTTKMRNDTPDLASIRTPTKSPSKSRSFSESLPELSPSPKFRESRKESKDDQTINWSPKTPRRPEFLSRGLSLQMPPRESGMHSPASFTSRAPLSPQLDRTHTYASPIHLLPRRSRGAEFSRACTNLHHSTLAEQSSPDSSPTITQKGMMIPPRKGRSNSFMLDSPSMGGIHTWNSGHGDRTAISSSVGSINMLGTESSSSGSDMEDAMEPDDNDDPMLMTPQVTKTNHNIPPPFGFPTATAQSPGGWPSATSPGGPNFMSIQRARLRKARSRKSSSSASGRSSIASPGPASPPHARNIEGSGGYFAREAVMRKTGPRRESLSLHTNDLHISSGNDSGDEAGPPLPTTPGVVRRPVTRRGNLLPKSRQFGLIKAQLIEESAPLDSETRREAEIIRQVRESDAEYDPLAANTAQSSPSLMPTAGLTESLEDIPEDSRMTLDNGAANTSRGLFGTFGSGVLGFPLGSRGPWSSDLQSQTPPPSFLPRGSSSAVSDDMTMDSPAASSASVRGQDGGTHSSVSRSGTPQAPAPPTAAEGLKKSNKRRRDDDLDAQSLKRRAVSPGVSVHNSPILSQSPGQREGIWGAHRRSREGSVSGHGTGDRSGSGGSLASMTPVMGPKRIGLQGMTDTHDGLMKMSIE